MATLVYCWPPGPGVELLGAWQGGLGPFRLAKTPAKAAVRLEVVSRELRAPFVVRGAGEAALSTHLSGEIAAYAGTTEGAYLRTMALAGLLVARAMSLNPLLRVDDFRHANPANCLMSERFFFEEYFQAMESPCLCRGCRVFYGALCPAEEVAALERQIALVGAVGLGIGG